MNARRIGHPRGWGCYAPHVVQGHQLAGGGVGVGVGVEGGVPWGWPRLPLPARPPRRHPAPARKFYLGASDKIWWLKNIDPILG
jgi:hypothetical protein